MKKNDNIPSEEAIVACYKERKKKEVTTTVAGLSLLGLSAVGLGTIFGKIGAFMSKVFKKN